MPITSQMFAASLCSNENPAQPPKLYVRIKSFQAFRFFFTLTPTHLKKNVKPEWVGHKNFYIAFCPCTSYANALSLPCTHSLLRFRATLLSPCDQSRLWEGFLTWRPSFLLIGGILLVSLSRMACWDSFRVNWSVFSCVVVRTFELSTFRFGLTSEVGEFWKEQIRKKSRDLYYCAIEVGSMMHDLGEWMSLGKDKSFPRLLVNLMRWGIENNLEKIASCKRGLWLYLSKQGT